MRKMLVSILALLAVVTQAKSSEIGKDGFNYYKDYLRGRSDDVVAESPPEDRIVYFYRTPLSLYPRLLPALDQEYRKRTGNVYKNHMLSKDQWNGAAPSKRSSKAALSFLMQGKHPIYSDEKLPCPYGKQDVTVGSSEETAMK